jgi:PAB-dependent poly(A)-specific ribonuclease subunit 3
MLTHEGTATPTSQIEPETNTFNIADIKEFTPRTFDSSQAVSHFNPTSDLTLTPSQSGANGNNADVLSYDPFSMQNLNQAMPTGAYNPYLEDSNIPTNAASYFQAQTAFAAPAQPVCLMALHDHSITDLIAPIPPLRTHWSS